MKIGLIAPPGMFSLTEFASAVVPPLGLAYCAAALVKAGHGVVLCDAQGESPNCFTRWHRFYIRGIPVEEIPDQLPVDLDIIGISHSYSFMTPLIGDLISVLRRRFPSQPIILGGAHATALPEQCLMNPDVSLVVRGEAEEVLPRLMEALSPVMNEDHCAEIPGIAFRKRDGSIVVTGEPCIVENLDSLPLPHRDGLPMTQYQRIGQPHGAPRGRWTTLIASRGCPFDCAFCTTPALSGRRWRIRSVESVLEEMDVLHEQFGVTDFHFEDDNLTVRANWIDDFCRGIRERNRGYHWQINVGAATSSLSPEMIRTMAGAGLTNITFAPESGSSRVLREIMKKDNDLELIKSAVALTNELNIMSCLFFIIGIPGETKTDLQQTLSFLRRVAMKGADDVSLALFTPLPGSTLFEQCVTESNVPWNAPLFLTLANQSDTMSGISWNSSFSERFLRRIRFYGFLQFYLIAYLTKPKKLFRLIRNIVRGIAETKSQRIIAGKIAFLRNTFGKNHSTMIK